MNIALWIVQIFLAVGFAISGGMKLFAFDKYKATAEKSGKPGPSRGLSTFIGISEIAGAMGLILPVATGIVPVLTPLAAVGLGIIMILAAGYHLRRKEPIFVPLFLLALSVFVVVGRGFLLN